MKFQAPQYDDNEYGLDENDVNTARCYALGAKAVLILAPVPLGAAVYCDRNGDFISNPMWIHHDGFHGPDEKRIYLDVLYAEAEMAEKAEKRKLEAEREMTEKAEAAATGQSLIARAT